MTRGIPGTTPGHGTTARARTCRCAACLTAKARYDKWRSLHDRTRLDPTGPVRRLRALYAIGWSAVQIADELGVTAEAVRARVRSDRRIERDTAAQIDAVYRRLSMTPGPSTRARRIAERRGYAPPLAWDNIDDLDERPDLGERSRGTDLDEWLWLVRSGEDPSRAAERLDVTLHAIERAAYRNNRTDVTAIANAARHAERKAS